MTKQELGELLDVIADRASKLRDAGVRGQVVIGEVAFFVYDDAGEASTAKPAPDIGDPLDDPETYGLPPGSQIPGGKAKQ